VNRLIARSRQEDGAVMLIALGFLTFLAVVTVVLVNYATTSIRATISLRDVRGREYAADGVVDAAINKVRGATAAANSDKCLAATINGLALRVDCREATGTVGTGTDVTFTACPAAEAQPCPANRVRLVARVKYNRSATPSAVTVMTWSVQR
jgi:hypothetical protein